MNDDVERNPLDPEDLYIYSDEDFGRILGDAYVDVREVVEDDKTAAAVVDIMYGRLTDGFYATKELE